MHNLKHNKVLHEKNIILTVVTAETPRVKDADRVRIEPVNEDFKKLFLTYGFMESPNVPKTLGLCKSRGSSSTSWPPRSSSAVARWCPRRIRACLPGRTSCSFS